MRPTTFHLDTTGLDDQTACAVTDYLINLTRESGPLDLHLDFRKVEWISSTAVSTLIGLNRRVAGAKSHLVLENVNDHVASVFRLSRLDRLLDVRPRPAV